MLTAGVEEVLRLTRSSDLAFVKSTMAFQSPSLVFPFLLLSLLYYPQAIFHEETKSEIETRLTIHINQEEEEKTTRKNENKPRHLEVEQSFPIGE